jgi:hydrogenase expression/formation protein HypE
VCRALPLWRRTVKDSPLIRLEHGSGGALSRDLVESIIHPIFHGDAYPELSDAGPVEVGSDLLMTTDGYVVDPPFFPGGDIGRLSIFGTCNDLAVCGAKPICISLALVIEEGFPIASLTQALESAAAAAKEANARIVTGDTKVVPRGKGGGLFVTTTGLGRRVFPHVLSPSRIQNGDSVIVSGPLGAHGLTVLAARESLPVAGALHSDMAFLYPPVSRLFHLADSVHFMRDATRGGVASVLNEAAHAADWGIETVESEFPVTDEVRTVSDLLGLNPLEIANEGVFVVFAAQGAEEEALNALRAHALGKFARCVGHVTRNRPGTVIMTTRVGGKRILDFPRGLLLPRIC